MTANQIRQKFLKFFEEKNHKVIPSSSLVPENDPTVLFTTAGMQPLVPYLLGEKHALGKRLVNSQKCLRTDDIEEVGDNTHLTFFEMLGNWSLGDYFKRETIEWSFQFLFKELAISVFEGDKSQGIPRDEESAKIWQELGVSKERIVYLGREDNWWGPAGKTGPCGPDTEIFYWTGREPAPEKFDPDDERWFEIWNDVFMEYNKQEDGSFVALAQKNVDTGMGLERIAAALQAKDNVFETDLFLLIIKQIRELALKKGEQEERIIADHIKASVFILAEKICPSNLERGYVLRRLIRRAIRYGKLLGIEKDFTAVLAEQVIEIYKEPYPELVANQEFIFSELNKEEDCFRKTLEKGLKELNKLFPIGKHERVKAGEEMKTFNRVDAKKAFYIFQSFGFPLEMIQEELARRVLLVDEQEFKKEFKKHQELSRTAAAGKFKSGLADQSEKTIKCHTAAHLLLAGLREVLGCQVEQRGSNITSERIRFDFTFDRKLTTDELKRVGEWVNDKIEQGLEVKVEEMTVEEAQKQGALAFFRDKYPDKVKVFTVFNKETGEVFSKEICSGPHVCNTSEIGKLKITKEQSSSQGVRRFRAVLE